MQLRPTPIRLLQHLAAQILTDSSYEYRAFAARVFSTASLVPYSATVRQGSEYSTKKSTDVNRRAILLHDSDALVDRRPIWLSSTDLN